MNLLFPLHESIKTGPLIYNLCIKRVSGLSFHSITRKKNNPYCLDKGLSRMQMGSFQKVLLPPAPIMHLWPFHVIKWPLTSWYFLNTPLHHRAFALAAPSVWKAFPLILTKLLPHFIQATAQMSRPHRDPPMTAPLTPPSITAFFPALIFFIALSTIWHTIYLFICLFSVHPTKTANPIRMKTYF